MLEIVPTSLREFMRSILLYFNEGIIDNTREHFSRHGKKYLLGAGALAVGGLGLHGWANNPEGLKRLGRDVSGKISNTYSKVKDSVTGVTDVVVDDAKKVYNRDIKKQAPLEPTQV